MCPSRPSVRPSVGACPCNEICPPLLYPVNLFNLMSSHCSSLTYYNPINCLVFLSIIMWRVDLGSHHNKTWGNSSASIPYQTSVCADRCGYRPLVYVHTYAHILLLSYTVLLYNCLSFPFNPFKLFPCLKQTVQGIAFTSQTNPVNGRGLKISSKMHKNLLINMLQQQTQQKITGLDAKYFRFFFSF